MKDRLKRFGVIDIVRCFVCDIVDEIKDYLYFDCQFNMRCIRVWKERFNLGCRNFLSIVEWIRRLYYLKVQRMVMYVSLFSLVYKIWEIEIQWCRRVIVVILRKLQIEV